jgi:hypothetical protein
VGNFNWLMITIILNVRIGMMGAVFAVLCHVASGAMNVCLVGFPKDIREVMYAGMSWKEWMLK